MGRCVCGHEYESHDYTVGGKYEGCTKCRCGEFVPAKKITINGEEYLICKTFPDVMYCHGCGQEITGYFWADSGGRLVCQKCQEGERNESV